MSYILDALKKAEQQRGLGRVPGLGSVHEQASGGVRRRWLWGVTGLLILNAAVLLVVFWPEQRRDIRDDAPPVQPPRQAAAQHPEGGGEQPRSSRAVQAEDQEPVHDPAVQPRLVSPTPDQRRQQRALRSPVAVDDAEIPARPQETGARPDEARNIPVWPQIPVYLFEQLTGSLRLDVHVFASQPAERFVLINMKKYHQGQQLQEGPRLDEITADGVILSFRGEKFRLQAQQ
jgi:general secretion pathway protein B